MAIDIVDGSYPNGSTRLIAGEIVKLISTRVLEKSIASSSVGTIGVVMSGSAAVGAADVLVCLSGTPALVLLETGLTPLAGDLLWLSNSVAGRATNVAPGVRIAIGTISDASGYARTGGVVADINSLASVAASGGATGATGAAGSPGGATGATGATGVAGATGVGATGATGTAGGAGGIAKFAGFYGLTAGTGNSTTTDYAATVAVKTSPGTGRVPFPRNGPAVGIVRVDGSSFTLPDVGTYAVTFRVQTTEPGQLQLELNGTAQDATTAGNQNPTSGGHEIMGSFLITTVAINAVLAVINPISNTTALTVVPADGAETHANAQTLTILKVA